MRKTRILILITALIVSGTAAIALAVRERPDRIGPMPLPPRSGYNPEGGLGSRAMHRPLEGLDPVNRIRGILLRLDLTDTQREKVKGILEDNREGLKQAQEARGAAMKAFREAVQAGDEAAIRSAGTEVGNAMANGAVIRSQCVAAIKAVLTPDQLAQLEKMKERAKQSIGRQLGDRVGRPGLDRFNPPQKAARNAEVLRRLTNERIFNKIDRNGDGAITLQEINAFQRQKGKDRPAKDQELD